MIVDSGAEGKRGGPCYLGRFFEGSHRAFSCNHTEKSIGRTALIEREKGKIRDAEKRRRGIEGTRGKRNCQGYT